MLKSLILVKSLNGTNSPWTYAAPYRAVSGRVVCWNQFGFGWFISILSKGDII